MADYNSSLPVRTENNGDVVSKLCDGTTTSQLLAIDSSGRITVNQGVPNSIANKWPVLSTDGTNSQSFTAAGQALVKDGSDGPVSPGTAALFSVLAGGQFNTVLPTLANTQQAALQVDSSGRLIISPLSSSSTVTVSNFPTTVDTNYGTVGANTIRTAAQIGNATGAADFNFGTVGAQTLRVASEVGNSTGAADFNNGATGAQTLRVAANLAIAGANVTASNPVPVTMEDTPGTHINDYKQAVAIAAGATDNHDYTVTAGKTLHLQQLESSSSGKAKMELQIETGVATGVFTPYFVQFNSTATPNMSVHLDDDILVAAGVRVRVIMKNKDVSAEDLYSTISGFEA